MRSISNILYSFLAELQKWLRYRATSKSRVSQWDSGERKKTQTKGTFFSPTLTSFHGMSVSLQDALMGLLKKRIKCEYLAGVLILPPILLLLFFLNLFKTHLYYFSVSLCTQSFIFKQAHCLSLNPLQLMISNDFVLYPYNNIDELLLSLFFTWETAAQTDYLRAKVMATKWIRVKSQTCLTPCSFLCIASTEVFLPFSHLLSILFPFLQCFHVDTEVSIPFYISSPWIPGSLPSEPLSCQYSSFVGW